MRSVVNWSCGQICDRCCFFGPCLRCVVSIVPRSRRVWGGSARELCLPLVLSSALSSCCSRDSLGYSCSRLASDPTPPLPCLSLLFLTRPGFSLRAASPARCLSRYAITNRKVVLHAFWRFISWVSQCSLRFTLSCFPIMNSGDCANIGDERWYAIEPSLCCVSHPAPIRFSPLASVQEEIQTHTMHDQITKGIYSFPNNLWADVSDEGMTRLA